MVLDPSFVNCHIAGSRTVVYNEHWRVASYHIVRVVGSGGEVVHGAGAGVGRSRDNLRTDGVPTTQDVAGSSASTSPHTRIPEGMFGSRAEDAHVDRVCLGRRIDCRGRCVVR